MSKKQKNNLVGAAGQYYVCAELAKRGYLALLTPKNNPLFDVVVTNEGGSDAVSIQVKTKSIGNNQGWKLGKSISTKQTNSELFVVLVDLKEEGRPDFYIYDYKTLSDSVSEIYEKYLVTPKRDGNKRKDVDFRWFDKASLDMARKDNWGLITNKLLEGRKIL
jgi:hypothetical protein